MGARTGTGDPLHWPLTALRGIGPRRAQQLADSFGLRTVGDLLRCAPRRYEAAAARARLADAPDGALVRVRAAARGASLWRSRGRNVLQVRLEDGSGRATAYFFNQPYLRAAFPAGRDVTLEGRACRRPELTFFAPRVVSGDEPVPEGLQPVYPQADGVPRGLLPRAAAAALPLLRDVAEALPAEVLAAAGVPPLAQALAALHAPAERGAAEAGRRRLAWEEILNVELRRRERTQRAPGCGPLRAARPEVWARIQARLPFELTADQERVLATLRADLARGAPLARLLHGEVGSGKTAVAFALSLAVAAEGGQTAVLAPTEILARQHLATFRGWLQGSRVPVAGILGDDAAAARRSAIEELESGRALVAIGTHGLCGPEVRFRDLRLVVLDEQHRFGVRQKAALLAKGRAPHVLTMTATPIPRTLAWARYGALEPCELRARPPGFGTVRTCVRSMDEWPQLAAALRGRLRGGERAFVVVPRIDGRNGLLSRARELLQGAWSGIGAALIHGRMPGAEAAEAVSAFRRGAVSVLMGTTVVEVGLDVPAVSLMVVLNAERLGLASLHQLRGRAGRGPTAQPAECWILAETAALERIRLLETCPDGFAVAREDLRQRGPGALRGLRQHGPTDFAAFDPERDGDLLDALKDPSVAAWLEAAGGAAAPAPEPLSSSSSPVAPLPGRA